MIIVKNVCVPKFEEEHHHYEINGRRVPSVSRILEPLSSLVYGGINQEMLKRAAVFGTDVHLILELDGMGTLDEESVDPDYWSYLNAFRNWRAHTGAKVLHVEQKLGCDAYCGTIDLLCEIDGEPWVVDYKTTTQIHAHVGLQTAAYEALARAMYGHEFKRAALQLKGDGSFSFIPFAQKNDYFTFQALVGVERWRTLNVK